MSRTVEVEGDTIGYVQRISVGQHLIHSDVTVQEGGEDFGPDPHDLVLAALGACTSMTVQMYARRKGWPLERVHVELLWTSFAANDSVNFDNKSALVNGIELTLSFSGDLSEEQTNRLVEIAARCPIHRLLQSPTPIRTRLAQDYKPEFATTVP